MPGEFPVFLQLAGSRALVVGGGDMAAAKIRLLRSRGVAVTVIATEPGEAVRALLGDSEVDLVQRPFQPGDLEGISLVFAADEDEDAAASVCAAARQARLPVNAPDRPHLSSFIMPAIVDRDPLLVAVSSGGSAPILARTVRARLEAVLEARLGGFARFLEGFKLRVRAAIADGRARRRLWERAADGPIARAFLEGRENDARQGMEALLGTGEAGVSGSVALVGAGPGDPELLTLKALRHLQQADVVVHDRLVDPRILALARRDARFIDVGKRKADHTMPQAGITALLVAEARAGSRVVRLKGGDPFIFGRGGEEMEGLRAAGVPVEIVPGITAALGCAAATGIPLTHRDHAQAVTFLTAHGQTGEPPLDWDALGRACAGGAQTLAIYMGLSQAEAVAERLSRAGVPPSMPVALVENGTRPEQRLFRTDLMGLAEAASRLSGPALIIIGEVVRLADPAALLELSLAAEREYA